MKIILSPSKTQADAPLKLNVDTNRLTKTIALFKVLKKYSKNKLAKVLKIKGALLDKTYDLYQSFDESNKGIKAIDCYEGVVFEQIDHQDLSPNQNSYLNSHLVILSAMYGVLEPTDVIWPYRLDMGHKPNNQNLYHYWQEAVNDYLKNEDCIVNLASAEFSKMLKNERLINIHFLDQDVSGQLKVIGFNAKKARGMMANQMIKDTITHPEDIKALVINNYHFDTTLSDPDNYYFIKS